MGREEKKGEGKERGKKKIKFPHIFSPTLTTADIDYYTHQNSTRNFNSNLIIYFTVFRGGTTFNLC